MSNFYHKNYNNRRNDSPDPFYSNIKFTDENGNLRRELITTEAERIANNFKKKGLTNSQLRKFYNEVKALEAQINATEGDDNEKFKKNEAMIAMLKSKVAYAYHRPQGKKVEALKDFIYACVDKINSLEDFRNFIIFFEAVVGFSNLRG